MKYLPEVVSARVVGPTTLALTFDDGTRRRVDVAPLLRGPVLRPLLDPRLFRRARVSRAAGTVTWPNGADLAPETLYRMREARGATRARKVPRPRRA
jgi:hypothetical protein